MIFIISSTFFLAKSVNLLIAHYFAPPEFPPIQVSQPEPVQPKADIHETDISGVVSKRQVKEILKRGLFGKENPGSAERTPRTKIPLLLWGTVVYGKSQYSVALISGKEKLAKATFYAVGEKVMNAEIVSIDRLKVILLIDGKEQVLEPDLQIKTIQGLDRQDTNISVKAKTETESIVMIPEHVIESVRRNLGDLLLQAKMVPIFENGKLNGFDVKWISPGSLYENIGLKVGDRISKINGEALNEIPKIQDLYKALEEGGSVHIDLIRDGHEFHMELQIP